MGTLLMYLINTLIAGLTIHLFTGNRNRDSELKRLDTAAAHGLLASGTIALAVMLVIGGQHPATDTPQGRATQNLPEQLPNPAR